MVIPLFDDGRVLLESQYRYPIGKVMVEYPAGKLDPNEGALACAKRELQEETGYTAREYVYLTRIHPIISYSTEFIDIYLARGLTAGESKLDEGEFLELFTADRRRYVGMGPDRQDQRREDDHRHVLAGEGIVGCMADGRVAIARSVQNAKRARVRRRLQNPQKKAPVGLWPAGALSCAAMISTQSVTPVYEKWVPSYAI